MAPTCSWASLGEWTDAWTGEKIQSQGEWVKRPCPEGRAGLLFVRGGAILPTMEPADYIGTQPQRHFIVKVYPCGESEYVLNDCDAESYGYEEGLVARTRFHCSQRGKTVRLDVAPVEGGFENMPEVRDYTFQVALGCSPRRAQVKVNGTKVKNWTWADGILTVPVKDCPVSEALSLTIQL